MTNFEINTIRQFIRLDDCDLVLMDQIALINEKYLFSSMPDYQEAQVEELKSRAKVFYEKANKLRKQFSRDMFYSMFSFGCSEVWETYSYLEFCSK